MDRRDDGKAVPSGEQHKSSATHGPANVPLYQDIVPGLDLFVVIQAKTRSRGQQAAVRMCEAE